ncbi:MAG: cytochrome P460 family protein [Methyloprofundus sp.]|nr:cytochrome P460 family protein [Methyloprofundus sp.]MBW6453653.1 cytochrome P460 family protein [Methyloprofundus sp.]
MKKPSHLLFLSALICLPQLSYAEKVIAPANDIEYPKHLTNWRVISTSIRNDNNTQRVILGNALAVKAARAETKKIAWPNGAILAKLVWKNETLPTWQAATVPGDFVHAEIMVRDTKKYATTGGWGFARWTGLELTPHGKDSSAAQACFDCHQAAKATDYVFTQPAKLP